ncbi:MAG: hypothetical protein ACREJI_09410, partial [Candidatus Methylomirabilales bacterium]
MVARPVFHQTPGWRFPPLPRALGLTMLLVILTCVPQGSESQGEEGGSSQTASPALLELGRSEQPAPIPA